MALQDYQAMDAYLTNELVDGMASNPALACESICLHVARLGCQNGTEATYQRIAALLLRITEGMQSRFKPQAQLHQTLVAVKNA